MSVVSLSPDLWQWSGVHEGRDWLVEVQVTAGEVHVESGPAEEEARRHESGCGRQAYADFLAEPAGWVWDFPDLAEWITRVVRSRVSRERS